MDAHCPRCNRLLMQLSDGPVCAWGCVGWPHWTGDSSVLIKTPKAGLTWQDWCDEWEAAEERGLTAVAPLGVRGIDVGAKE